MKKEYYKWQNIFKHQNFLRANLKIESDLSNYATKTDLKNATGIATFAFAKKTDLANLKSDVDRLNIDELNNVSRHLP